MEKIRGLLSAVRDLQHLVSICVHSENNLRNDTVESKRSMRSKITRVLSIRSLLSTVALLHSTLINARSSIILKSLSVSRLIWQASILIFRK
jgi:hypothetical protein